MAASQKTILCIDDDPNAVMIRRLVLESAGYAVTTATTGEASLQFFREQDFNLVISDHFLRGVTGGEIAAQMKAMKPGIPIVILSGYPERPEGTEHADVYLEKGGSPPVLLATIKALLFPKANAKGV